jgi:hypothetical protein
VVDQLRLLWNRPLGDADRVRLFAIAVALIAAVTAVLAVHGHGAPAARPVRPAPTPFAVPSGTPWPEQRAPSEEGDSSAARAASPADVAAGKRAARAFLAGYLPYTYGHAVRLRAAAAALRRTLRSQPPRVPAAERRRHARVVALQSDGVSRRHASVTALVDDGARRYSVTLELAHRSAGWIVTSLGS